MYIGGIISAVLNTGETADPASLVAQIAAPLILFVLLSGGVGIWAFVEWVLIAAGAAKDGTGKSVRNW